QGANRQVGVTADDRSWPRLSLENAAKELPALVDTPIALREVTRLDGDRLLRQSIADTLQARLGTVVVVRRLRHHTEAFVTKIDKIVGDLVQRFAIVGPNTGPVRRRVVDKGVHVWDAILVQ